MRCHVPPHRARVRPPLRSSVRPNPACRSSIAFRSVRAAAGLPAARPCFARIAWARAPAFAPARFARLIARACARGQTQGARLPSVPLGFFRTGAKQETKRPADAACSCPILPQFYRGQALTENYFIFHERIAAIDHGSDAPVIPSVVDGNRCQSPGSATVRRSRGIRCCPNGATPTCHPGRRGAPIRGPACRGTCGLRRQCWAPDRSPGRQCGPVIAAMRLNSKPLVPEHNSIRMNRLAVGG